MADIQQTATVEVQVNGEQAKNELQSLEKYATSLKDRIADAYSTGDTKKMKELERELKKTNSQLRSIRTNAVNIDEVMQNLSTAGPKELQKTLRAINKELESGRIKRGTQEWNEYQNKLKLVNAEIRKIKDEGVEAEGFLSRMNGKLSKWGGMIASAAVAVTGLSMAFSKMRKDSMDKEESQDNLKALTGLDDESIAWLTQQAEVLSTTMDKSGLRVKQSSQEILEAYTLVGSAKPELLTDKEALNAVTIETMRLSTAAKMDLKESVDAVTLSMNQYGASADEAAKYTNVMAAGSKFGSVAVQSITAAVIKAGVSASGADVSIEQLVGTIETLGEKGIKDEVAGTGLKTFFLRLQTGADETNPKVVGLQTALKNLQKLSTQDILARFGQEAYTVAQTLIAGADKVDYYTKAVTGTNVATEQAAINSDNAAAKMAQMKNQLKEAGIELMEKLNPSVNLLGTYFTNLIKIMPPVIDFLKSYSSVIITMIQLYALYLLAMKSEAAYLITKAFLLDKLHKIQKIGATIQVLYSAAVANLSGNLTGANKVLTLFNAKMVASAAIQKVVTAGIYLYKSAMLLLTGNVKMATVAIRAFWAIISANPIGLVVTALAALAYGIYKFCTYTTEADKAVKDFSGRNVELQRELRKTYTALIAAKDGTQSRKDMIKEFNDKYGGYLTNLLSEESTLQDIKKAYNEVTVAMQRKLAGQVLQEKTEEIERGNLDKKAEAIAKVQEVLSKGLSDSQLQKVMPKIVSHVDEYIQQGKSIKSITKSIINGLSKDYDQLNFRMKGGNWGFDLIEDANGELEDYVEMVKNGADEVEKVKKKLKPFLNEPQEKPNNVLDDVVITPDKKTSGSGGGGSLDDDAKKKRIQEFESETAQFKAHTTSMYATGKITKQEYDESIIQSDKDLLQKKMALYSEKSKEYSDFLIQLKQMDIKNQEQCNKETLEEIEAGIKAEKRSLLDQYMDKTLNKIAYDEGIIRLDREAIVRKQSLYAAGTKEFNDYQKQLEDFDAQDKERRHKAYEEKLAEFRKEYQKKSLKEIKEKELADLKLIYEGKLELAEEYGKMILAIEQKYAGLGAEEPGIMEKVSQKTNDNLNKAKDKAQGMYTDEDRAKAENGDPVFALFGAEAKMRQNTLIALQDMEKDDKISHQEYLQAKALLDAEYFAGMADKMQAAYAVMNTIVSAYSEYNQASQDLEEAKINKRYDAEIKAAGNSTAKKKQIEERKEKELAKAKSKYADRAFKIQIAQGLAQTAMGAINAYTSALAVPVIGIALAPIAAAAAIAAGMLQMATITKQHEAAKQGYASGGFTPSGRWDEEKGSVHAGEFVANRFAVRNKQILPALQLIDNAQKNNTIGSLTAKDVTSVLSGRQAIPSAQAGSDTNSGAENSDESLKVMLGYTYSVIDRLAKRLNEPFHTVNAVDGPDGIKQAMDKYDSLQRNKSRA